MILSSDELEILAYLKSWNGKFVTMIEVCRCAGGRQKFRDTPNWAKGLMSRLVEAGLVGANERGHYCSIDQAAPPKSATEFPLSPKPALSRSAVIVGDDYFPAASETPEAETSRWVSPQIAEILKQSGKKFNGQK